jgi:two-component system NarL family sensor kinase
VTGYPVLVGLAVLGLSALAAGGGMLALRGARVPGACLVLGGGGVLAGALVVRTSADGLAPFLWTAGGLLLLPLAVTTYPRPAWRHPVDFVALTLVAGAGLVGTAWWRRLGTIDRLDVVTSMAIVVAITVFLHTWWKVERLTDGPRRAAIWLALALAVAAIVNFLGAFLSEGRSSATEQVLFGLNYAVLALVPAAMYVGLRRPELVDVRGLVVRAAVLITALIVYLSLYATAAAMLELLGNANPSVGVMGVVAALAATTLHPMQVALRGVMDELLFGRRPDPLGAAGIVAERISDDPALALLAIREALVLPWAELRVDDEPVATSGDPVSHTRRLGLPVPQGTAELVVGLRPGDLGLTANDEHVLRLVSPLLAQTLHARALAEDLQDSREQTISAIEEERRRLRRDLHDGLGPRLSGIAFTSDAARNTMRDDPAAAEELLRSLRAETVTAIQEIRELVYAMRPPALDELGLVSAVVQQTALLRTPAGEPLQVTMDAPELPHLPAAVEVAAYRIVVEALTNVARHTDSTSARVTLSLSGSALTLEVEDRGGQSGPWTPGVGLSSMRERAEELGGSLEVAAGPGGGRLHAVLPLPA